MFFKTFLVSLEDGDVDVRSREDGKTRVLVVEVQIRWGVKKT
jgi:hypothetical protein